MPACVDRWVNVADRLDPVALDSDISNDFAPAGWIENDREFGLNPDSPRHPHSGTGYLRTAAVRDAVRETVGNAFGQAVARAVITKDLVAEIEDGLPEERHRTLIQLAAEPRGSEGAAAGARPTLDDTAAELTEAIERMVAAGGEEPEAARVD